MNLIILALIALISYLAFQNKKLLLQLALIPKIMHNNPKQRYRILSSGFVHADFNHLLFNGITLYFFGSFLEKAIGPVDYLILFLGGILFGNLPSIMKQKDNENYISLGASGGVSSLLFAFIYLYPTQLIYVFFIIPLPAFVFGILFVAYSFYANHKGRDGINHLAHLAGAAFGFLWVLFL